MCYLIVFTAAWMAVCKPALLLSPTWNKVAYHLFFWSLMLQLFIFFNVIFIDLYQFIFVLAGVTFVKDGHNKYSNELYLNIMVRIIQGLVGCMSVFICSALMKARAQRRKKAAEANSVLKELKKLKKVTWADNQRSDDKSES